MLHWIEIRTDLRFLRRSQLLHCQWAWSIINEIGFVCRSGDFDFVHRRDER